MSTKLNFILDFAINTLFGIIENKCCVYVQYVLYSKYAQ